MSATVTTHDHPFAAQQRMFTRRVHQTRPGAWARPAVRRLAAALKARRRSARARAAFSDAYEALHRLDQRVLLDIGVLPGQLTAFAQVRGARVDN